MTLEEAETLALSTLKQVMEEKVQEPKPSLEPYCLSVARCESTSSVFGRPFSMFTTLVS